MLPTRLNLLLPTKRKYLKRMVYVQFVKSLLETLLITVSITGIILLGGRTVLEEHFNDLAENITLISNQHADTNALIRDINANVKQAQKIQKTYVHWTPLIETVLNAIPETTSLESIDMDINAQSFTISGQSQNRQELLRLEEQLEALDIVKSANVPINQLTQKENIPFTISVSLIL